MLPFVLGLIALVLLVYLVLRVATARRSTPLRRGPVAAPTRPDDDEDFLRELRRRADEQRRRARDPRDD